MLQTLKRLIGRRPKYLPSGAIPSDIPAADRGIMTQIAGYTMTSYERQAALIQAVRYIVRAKIPGDIVECGVWRGGSVMAAALALLEEGDTSRGVWLFDTFAGMTAPTTDDAVRDEPMEFVSVSLQDVRRNALGTSYPEHKFQFIVGPVEETIPRPNMPERIALLRLDTDWYESTKHELQHLYPLVHPGGVVIIDDYGHYAGARKATDEYFAGQAVYMHRIDYTARLIIKPAPRPET